MRSILLLFLVSMMALPASVLKGQAFRFFEGSYPQALSQASKEGKMLLVMTTASFSEASAIMVDEVMTLDEVGSFFNRHFLGWVLEADPLAPEFLFGKIRLLSVPEYLFIDAKGEVQYRASEYQSPEDMIEVGKKALDPANHSSALESLYRAGKRDPEFMQKYIFLMHANGKPVRDIAVKYLASLKPEALLLEPNWKITASMVDDPSARECRHVIENYGRYCEKFQEPAVRQFLTDVYSLNFGKAVEARDLGQLRTGHPLLEKIYPASGLPGIRATVEMNFFSSTEDWAAYRDAALKLLKPGSGHGAAVYNDAAANFYHHIDDQSALRTALSWVEISIGMDRQAWNLDTKAALLSKLGDREAALSAAKEAVKLAGDDPAPVEFSLDLLQNRK